MDQETSSTSDYRPHPIRDFFWFCSGANTHALKKCPGSEHIKYAGIGATVFFTGALASFSGGYALYTVFDSIPLSILFGLLWGGIIFNLDRFIVSTIKKDGNLRRQLTLAIPRFLLAMVLAVVISKPLELRIFESEILEILDDRRTGKIQQVEENYAALITAKEEDIQLLKEDIREKFLLREKNYQDYKCECDGTCGTGKVGRGSECSRKEKKYLQSDREYQESKQKNEAEITVIQTAIEDLEKEKKQSEVHTAEVFSSGLVARLSASNELPPGPGWFIMLLILLIETSPILAKVLSSRGPYDELQERTEEHFNLTQLEAIHQKKLEVNKKISLLTSIQKAQVEEEVDQKRKAMRALSNAQMELVKEQINEWLKKEKERLRQKGKS